ncbi:hypothetical protein [Thermoflavimicrobium daqui]|uniref:hypothetical protein n=1 Tax=Thermoflavimicrobium daqui TaxID=2137476 RepID=UPI0011AB3054|nr:hypothetical protein [Thermoflavimicrobium daqui]
MFSIETYQDPYSYFSQLIFKENEIHIVSESTLASYLKDYAKKQGDSFHIYTYDRLQRILYGDWYGLTELMLASKIRTYLQAEVTDPKQYRYLEEHIGEWVKAFRYLVELDLNDLSPVTQEAEEAFLFRKTIAFLHQDPQIQKLCKKRKECPAKLLYKKIHPQLERVYVYQMSQISADQMMFFWQLRAAKIPIIFRIPYYPQYPMVSLGWKELYEQVSRKSVDQWGVNKQSISLTKGRRWVHFLEQKRSGNLFDPLKIEFHFFESLAHFQHYLDWHQDGAQTRQYVTTSYPQMSQAFHDGLSTRLESNILSYPEGKFLYYFYQSSRDQHEIYLDYTTLVECMTSGWVELDDGLGKDILPILIDLESYMDGISTIREVKERFRSLEELLDVSKQFDQLAEDKIEGNQIKQYLLNPFRVFPYVHLDRHPITIRQIQNAITNLEDMIKELLPEEGKEISIKQHMDQLRKYWKQMRNRRKIDVDVEEQIEEILYTPLFVDWEVTRADLRQFFLSFCEQDQDRDQWGSLSSFTQIEGLTLTADEIHLTDLSKRGIDQVQQRGCLPSILSWSWLIQSIRQQFGEQNPQAAKRTHSVMIHYLADKLKENLLLFRLFFLLVFHRKKLIVSWIRGLHEQDEESSYLQLLFQLYGNGKELLTWDLNYEVDVSNVDMKDHRLYARLDHFIEQIPQVYWTDQEVCSRKFFYNSLLELHPIYTDDIHQQKVFALLGSLLSQQAGGKEMVRKMVYPLFPQWTDQQKSDLIEMVSHSPLRESLHFQGIEYPKALIQFQSLETNDQEQTICEVSEQLDERISSIFQQHVEAKVGDHCKTCPYLYACTEGEFTIERSM